MSITFSEGEVQTIFKWIDILEKENSILKETNIVDFTRKGLIKYLEGYYFANSFCNIKVESLDDGSTTTLKFAKDIIDVDDIKEFITKEKTKDRYAETQYKTLLDKIKNITKTI